MAMDWVSIIWVLQVASTWYMAGLIWYVQLAHYPLMNRVSEPNYIEFQRAHMNRTVIAVGPAMLIEAITATALLFVRPAFLSFDAALILFVLGIGIWLSSAFLQVPCHLKLEHGFDAAAHRRLVNTNWIRTALWTIRAIGLAWYLRIV